MAQPKPSEHVSLDEYTPGLEPAMFPLNSNQVIRSRLLSQLKLRARQPIPVCNVIDQAEVVSVPAISEFRRKRFHSHPAVLEHCRIEDGTRRNKTEIVPDFSVY